MRQLFQPLVAAVLGVGPEAAAEVAVAASGSSREEEGEAEQPEVAALQEALMGIYEFPDQQPGAGASGHLVPALVLGSPQLALSLPCLRSLRCPLAHLFAPPSLPAPCAGLYNYCKALEALETGLLGGFFYKHYCLATNVIGSAARGTMKRAVSALKAGYETPVFGLLDRCRVALGARIDAEVADRKGRLMDAIMIKYQLQQQQQQLQEQQLGNSSRGGGGGGSSSGCPFGYGSAAASAACGSIPASTAITATAAAADGGFEVARQQLFSWQGVPLAFQQMVAAELAQQAQQLGLVAHPSAGGKPLAFVDHAWGQMSPQAQVSRLAGICPCSDPCHPCTSHSQQPGGMLLQLHHVAILHMPCLPLCPQYRAWREAAALYQLGNPAWDAMFGRVLPQAAAHIRALLGLPASSQAAVTVQFGSNSHELVGRLLSVFMDRRRQGGGSSSSASGIQRLLHSTAAAAAALTAAEATPPSPVPLLRILTSDSEFYSLTRQLNRFAGGCAGLPASRAGNRAAMPPIVPQLAAPLLCSHCCRGGPGIGGCGAR